MRISTWITSLYICGLISVNKVVGDVFLYGNNHSLHCGGSPLPGEWFLNGLSTGVNNRTYTITNADFNDDGYYQCRRNGVDALNPPLEVIVYGRGNIIPLNCNSMSNGVCVMNVIRGQPVTLCVAFTTIPPLIPEGERVSNLSGSVWYFKDRGGDNVLLYSCTTSSCDPGPSLNRSLYTYFNISCLTINNVQENQQYEMSAFFDPSRSPPPSVIFNLTCEDAVVVYGGMFSLKCGIIVGCCIPQGDWYRNGELLQRNSSTLAVRNATFEDEGTYQYVNNGLSRSFLVAVYELVITIMVDSNQKDINGRAGCNYERTCCADDTRVTLNWFGSGGGPPLVSSSNIIVTSNQTGERKCTTIAFRPATVGSQEYTCFGTSGNRFVSLNFGIAIPAGTKPRSIQVYGDAQKNITGWNVGEPVTVSCTVDSCITGTYRIRFAFPNDTEISNRFFDTMMHTDTTTIILGQNNSGLYKCEVAAFNGTVLDTATFEFVGTKPRSIQVYGDAQKNIPGNVPVVPVSVAVVVVIIVAIVVSFTTATIIVIRYKHSKLTTNPTQSDSPQEPPSSSPSNLTVYRKKDVKMFDKIGRGSFWKVYRGKLLDSCCAIKRLRGVKKGGDHEGLVSKVLRELDMWSSLNHPNIISLYGIYHEDDINIPLLIVELMDRNLTDQLNSTFDPTHRKSLFPLKTKLSILSQVAGALDYLHCIERVIHGDLTSNNILLKENSPGSFTSKLTDFGMSRALNEQDNVMSTVQGTYSYMPPEVQNAGETTTKVDIYSFGVLCVHVLSHRFPKPMHACNVDDLGAHVVVSEFSRYRPYLMELDDDEKLLEPLIEECLQYEPEDRLRSEEVIGQLNSIEGRLSLKETGPSNPSHQPSVIHQQFSGPIVSGCTISGSVMNVGSFTNRNMQSLPVVDTAPLPAPLEVIPEVSFGGNIPNTSTSLTAPSEVNPA